MCTPVGEGGPIPASSDTHKGTGRFLPPAGGAEVIADQLASLPVGRSGAPKVLPVRLDKGNEVARDVDRGAAEHMEDEGSPASVVPEATLQ